MSNPYPQAGVPSPVLMELGKRFPGREEQFTADDVVAARIAVRTQQAERMVLAKMSLVGQMRSTVVFRADGYLGNQMQ